jgi:hypothetical protein
MSVSIRVVVARYREDVSWTRVLPNVTIYNKGEPLSDQEYNQVFLPNVGREQHTFFWHIVKHYDELDDYTVFLQGDPFDHCRTVLERISQHLEAGAAGAGLTLLGDHILDCNVGGCRHHPQLPLRETYLKTFGKSGENQDFVFCAGSQFIAARANIRQHPREFYANILKLIETKWKIQLPWVFERFTGLIYKCQHCDPLGIHKCPNRCRIENYSPEREDVAASNVSATRDVTPG